MHRIPLALNVTDLNGKQDRKENMGREIVNK